MDTMDFGVKDIPQLVDELRAQRARCKDMIAAQKSIRFAVETSTPEGSTAPVTSLIASVGGKAYRVQEQVHSQFGQKIGPIHGTYYRTCRDKGALELLAYNLNWWVERESNTKRLVRLIDDQIRAFLSDTFRPLDHLDLVTTAVQVITGRDGGNGVEQPWARGARCISWYLNPTKLDIGFVNPGIQIDLKNLERGVQIVDRQIKTGNEHAWIRPNDDGGDRHIVYPAAFLWNSETGHSSLGVSAGIYEQVCNNRARLGTDLIKRHLGRTLEEDVFASNQTLAKANALIYSQVADTIRAAFDPKELEKNLRRMHGLSVQDADIREAAEQIVKLPGLTEDVRDEILKGYRPLTRGQDTLLDVQRAVTFAAHAFEQDKPEVAIELEKLGGAIIEEGAKAYALAR